MYAGTTFRKGSGKIIGVHQKIDRVARRHLNKFISKDIGFPIISEIMKFEGKNGPDAVKFINSPKDKPWHFIDPNNHDDNALLVTIDNHISNLAIALGEKNHIRSSFEAAWLAHAITDGLTPAHHYPLESKVEELWGKPRNEFSKIKDRHIIKGENHRDTLSKNWQYWGAGGVMTAHVMFEMGVAMAIVSGNYKLSYPSQDDIVRLKQRKFEPLFLESLNKINSMKMYDRFCKEGWNLKLANETKKVLIPEIIKLVILAWYQATLRMEEFKK